MQCNDTSSKPVTDGVMSMRVKAGNLRMNNTSYLHQVIDNITNLGSSTTFPPDYNYTSPDRACLCPVHMSP